MSVNLTPKQLNDLGDQYFYGFEKDKNIELAFTYYKKAADLNNPIGYYNVGKYFIEKQQFKQAFEYLSKAKDLGYSLASITLSNMYLEGQGFKKNKKKAFKYMSDATQANDLNAIHQLGYFYEQGIGCKKNELQAKKYYQLSADNSIAKGMYHLGVLYLEAKNIKRDFEQGFFWLDKASEAGCIEAIKKTKSLYHDNHPYLRKKSVHFLQEMEFYYDELLAKQGDEEALKRVAFVYYEGNELIKINNEKAYQYFNNLLEKDNTYGYTGIGLMNLYGKACSVDYLKAKDLLSVSATRNEPIAMNGLGEMYRLGYGVDINYNRAKDYYFEAARLKESNALINMGLLNYRKQITGAKNEIAYQYMMQAIDSGNTAGYYWLGIFYDKGIGTQKDFKKAENAFLKAIETDNPGANYKYAQMLYNHVTSTKMSNKKKNVLYIKIRDLLFDYINNPVTSEINTTYAMYLLGNLYDFNDFDLKSKKVSRYYYELASSKKFTKAMVRMYHILKDTEPSVALDYLEEAVKRPADGESLYEMANLYYNGSALVEKDLHKAREFYGKSAGLNYHLAKEKLTMM